VSARKRAHTQVRPYNSFSCFYERNLVLGGFKNLQTEEIYGKRYMAGSNLSWACGSLQYYEKQG
jgi:hypothetical protein